MANDIEAWGLGVVGHQRRQELWGGLEEAKQKKKIRMMKVQKEEHK
jgi:hypothetical protein